MAKLLVVDDNKTLLELMETILSIEGHDVKAAKSGKEALEAVKTATPDLIICDATMPEMSGPQLLAAVRGHAEWHGIPFLFITGRDSWEMDAQIAKEKTTSILHKPFDPDHLYQAVADALATV